MSKVADTPYGDEVTVPIVEGGGGIQPGSTQDTAEVTLNTGGFTTMNTYADGDTAVAFAVTDDVFPRYIVNSDHSDGIFLGDGTQDPTVTAQGANIYVNGAGGITIVTYYVDPGGGEFVISANNADGINSLLFRGGNIIFTSTIGGYTHGLPTADPHVKGALWDNGLVVNISAG